MDQCSYIALLRGINVGRAKRVAMADLRALVAALGYADVRTLLNSGNVVFRGPPGRAGAAATAIEEALVRTLGVAARVHVIDSAELAVVMADNALLAVATELSRLIVFLLAPAEARAALEALAGTDWAPEHLALGRRAAYVWCPTGVLDSRAAAALGKLLGERTTARNWNTLGKLAALCEQA